MLRNYLKTATRNFLRQKSYTILNISGLAIGLASSLLIFLWVQDEWAKDKFHRNDAQLYQVLRNMHLDEGQVLTTESVPQPVKTLLDEAYPEVDQVALISWEIEFLLRKKKEAFREKGRYVSEEFLDVFSYRFLTGEPRTALEEPQSILLSDQLAIKFFGKDWNSQQVLGETIEINGELLTIKGIFSNPTQSSMGFDWLIPANNYIQKNSWVEDWENGGFRIVATLKEGVDPTSFQNKIEQEINNHRQSGDERLLIQKYSDRYLHGNFENGLQAGGRIENVKILSIVAIFMLIIACINFMNLSTARSTRRAQEIGVRKVLGAKKGALGMQFLTESFVIALMSSFIALLIAHLVLPYFNTLTGKSMILPVGHVWFWLAVVGTALVTGLLAGSYPAILLSSFNTSSALKGTIKHTKSAAFFRRGLVVFQFAISILLIIGTVTVFKQMQYIMTKNIGLDRENLVFVELEGETASKFETYKTELLRIPEVKSVTSTSGNPLENARSTSSPSWDGQDPEMNYEISVLMTGGDLTKTMNMEILKGRDFSNYEADSANYLINEEAARIMGFDNPIGERLSCWGIEGKVIGLVKNYHMQSLYHATEPLIIRFDPHNSFLAFVKIQGNTQDALLALEKVTKKLNPSYPFDYGFLEEEYANLYRSEQTISSLSTIFAAMTIFISCLGLFGLSSYAAEQRTRELGIRKVHGANTGRLVLLLSKDFTILIVIAFVIAAPIAWYVATDWLQQFAFHAPLGIGVFALSGLTALVIAGFTVSIKSYRAASADPVKTLKDE